MVNSDENTFSTCAGKLEEIPNHSKNDFHYFENIIPCGIVGKNVTSLEQELGRKVDIEKVKEQLKKNIELSFEMNLI